MKAQFTLSWEYFVNFCLFSQQNKIPFEVLSYTGKSPVIEMKDTDYAKWNDFVIANLI